MSDFERPPAGAAGDPLAALARSGHFAAQEQTESLMEASVRSSDYWVERQQESGLDHYPSRSVPAQLLRPSSSQSVVADFKRP
jgi:hypothetical protein